MRGMMSFYGIGFCVYLFVYLFYLLGMWCVGYGWMGMVFFWGWGWGIVMLFRCWCFCFLVGFEFFLFGLRFLFLFSCSCVVLLWGVWMWFFSVGCLEYVDFECGVRFCVVVLDEWEFLFVERLFMLLWMLWFLWREVMNWGGVLDWWDWFLKLGSVV